MLRTLYVRDYALIEELEVEFDSGLNIITGETGAGKSILLGALKLILGERASTEAVRQGARKAVVEGVFDDAGGGRLPAVLREHEIEPNESGLIFLRREVAATHSRAFVNDTPATLAVLREVAGHVIDLHGQHEHQSLLHTDTHGPMLDDVGGLGGLVADYQARYAEVAGLHRERSTLVRREAELRQQKDLIEFKIQEIDRVKPRAGEEDALEGERRILENAERLYEATAELYQLLYEKEDAVYDQLVVARNELRDLARIDPTFEEQLREIDSAAIIVDEATKFLQDYNSRIEFNPERLEQIRQRLGLLDTLRRKYGPSLEDVIRHREDIGKSYDLAADFEGAIARLDRQIGEAQQGLSQVAYRLSQKRHEVAERVERMIVAELAELGMPHARFEVHFRHQPDDDGWVAFPRGNGTIRYAALPTGVDEVEFFLSTNMGEEPRPLVKTASGGEVSRIMLGLKSVLAKSERLPILVFDEIDVGISGEIARKVGESMQRLAAYHQLITITHLPQIAALGDHHFLVDKHVEEGRTKSRIRRLDDAERAQEVAALIAGESVSEAALESARELISAGRRDGAAEA